MSAAHFMTATNNENSANAAQIVHNKDLIDSKFNELAKKILDEFQQLDYSRNFFQALDLILNETGDQHHYQTSHLNDNNLRSQKAKQERTRAKADKSQLLTRDTSSENNNDNFNELKKQCELISEKQRQLQEQLNSHQQILFDSQYRSLPVEITEAVASHEQRRAQAKLQISSQPAVQTGDSAVLASKPELKSVRKQQNGTTTTNKTSGGVKTSVSKENLAIASKKVSPTTKPDQQRQQRSAIPQSTILSGISQKSEAASNYPIGKSATVGAVAAGFDELSSGLKRQASLRLNKQTREAQQEFIQQQTRPIAASEKLKHRRLTKPTLGDLRPLASDESDLDDDDDDDDDDEFEYQNLASRRAYLNQRFINQQQEPPQSSKTTTSEQVTGGKVTVQQHPATAGRQRQQVTSTIQSGIKQAPVSTANMTVARQKQRFSNGAPVVRSSTIGASQMTSRPSSGGGGGSVVQKQAATKPAKEQMDQSDHEPRSLSGLLTSHDIGQMYKPHMNYSTSLLGNHRLSDDDEIIIIPTCQSPSLMSASVSPVGGGLQQQHQADGQHPDRTTNNIDEFSERFSISRTKSFWEKLANSKGGGGELDSAKCNGPSPQQCDKQYFNSSQRSLASGPNLVDSKSPNCSLLNQSGDSQNSGGQSANSQHHYPAAMKSAFDRMDSTGGSGNSHYSGCSSSSSTSGDEQTHSSNVGPLKLSERRAMLVSAAMGNTKPNHHHHQQSRRSPANASINPTINQLVQQDQLNRSDRFRQTR